MVDMKFAVMALEAKRQSLLPLEAAWRREMEMLSEGLIGKGERPARRAYAAALKDYWMMIEMSEVSAAQDAAATELRPVE
jgi:hypothetical protein